MAKIYLNVETLPGFTERITKLTLDSERQFGTMTVIAMMRHMRNVMETALGETSYPKQLPEFIGKAAFFISTEVFTNWPKGKLKAPSFWTPEPVEDFQEERDLWLASVEKFVEKVENDPQLTVRNPFFGRLTMKQWSLMNGMHVDHHLKQFSV